MLILSSPGRFITAGLLLLIGAHLLLGTLEVLHRPVFPWDAWLNWMYRAKAWYLSGQISDFDPVTLWASGAAPQNTYAVAGSHYPRLLPLIALGMAHLLGAWNEPLINLPYVMLGLAIAVGLYYVARRHGLGRVSALVCSYLAISTPLLGAHLSLAGQADIWMAGTTGLGFAALCSGLINRDRTAAVSGIALIGLGALFKVEGSLWLVAGGLLVLITFLGRRRMLILGATAACVCAVCIITGVQGFTLPGLGPVGLLDGRLYVPMLGSYALQSYDVADDYLSNFFLGASWNLLWYMVGAGITAALVSVRYSREAAVFITYFTLFIAFQILIFFFTEQGAWAEDWTAINRLPLQFTPALVFACVCLLQPARSPQHRGTESRPRRASEPSGRAFALGVSACLALAVLIGALAAAWPAPEDATPISFPAAQMRAIQGGWVPYRGGMSVQRYVDNVAIISSGPVAIDAGGFQAVRVSGAGSNRGQITLFWRRAGEAELHSRTLAGLGNQYTLIGSDLSWRGTITEIGVVIYDDGGSAKLETIEVHPYSMSLRIRQFVADKLWVNPWSQKSVHWLPGGNPDTPTSAALVAIAICLLAGVTIAFVVRSKSAWTSALLGSFLGAWILLDTSWLYQRASLARETMKSYELAETAPLDFGDDVVSFLATGRATCDLISDRATPSNKPERRLLIASNSDKDMRYQLLRAKYNALPVAAHAHEHGLESLPVHLADRVLVLKLRYGAANARVWDSEAATTLLSEKAGRPVRVAWENDNAYMLLVGDAQSTAACWRVDPA